MIAAILAAAALISVVEAPGPIGPLQGTMISAGRGAPVAIIIPGSGPTDRDGNNSIGLAAASYRLLAEDLAQRGVSSLRIDKRGIGASRGAVADANAVTIDDYATDVRAWVQVARRQTGAPCVWLIGHSEGGLIALVTARSEPALCGVVLASAAGRPLGTIIREQLRGNPANPPALLTMTDGMIDTLEAGRRIEPASIPPMLMPLFAPQVQGFLINQMSYDPAKLVAEIAKPVLIMQGTTDLQVTPADADRLAAAQPRARLVMIEGVNHLLKAAPMDRAANIATYANPHLPLAPQVGAAIADFIQAGS